MSDTIRITQDARGVAVLELHRPDRHNAMSATMIAELTEAAAQLGADPSVRVVVLAAAGESFCAGGDLGWMREQMQADAPTRSAEARKLARMLGALNELPKPVIARVQGQAFGGGLGLISVSDIAVGVEGARFGLTETRLGLIPATIGPYVAARIGTAAARRVFFSARIFGADEAARLGFLSQVVAPEALDAALEAEIAPFLACAPGAVAEAKALLRRLGPPLDESMIELSIAALARQWESEEAREGVAAFFARRPAAWVGGH